MRTYLKSIAIASLIFGAIFVVAETAFAAPTSTIVQNLIITSGKGGGTLCLQVTNTGLVTTSSAACGTGGGGAITINQVTTSTFEIVGTGIISVSTSTDATGKETITVTASGGGSGTVATSSPLSVGQWVIAGAYNLIYSTSSQPLLILNASGTNIQVSGPSATGTALVGIRVDPTFTGVNFTNATGSGNFDIATFHASGAMAASSTFNLQSAADFRSTLQIASGLSASSTFNLQGNADFRGTLQVASGVSASSTLNVQGNTDLRGTLAVANGFSASSTANIQGVLDSRGGLLFTNATGTTINVATASTTNFFFASATGTTNLNLSYLTADRLVLTDAGKNLISGGAGVTCGGTDKVSAISATGTPTCTADQTGAGGGGLATSTSGSYTPGNVAYFTGTSTLEATNTFTFATSTPRLDFYGEASSTAVRTSSSTIKNLNFASASGTNSLDLSSASTFQVPSAANPTVNATGSVALDTNNGLLTSWNPSQNVTGTAPLLFYNFNCSSAGNCNTEVNGTGTGGVQMTDDTSSGTAKYFSPAITIPSSTFVSGRVLRIMGGFETATGASPPQLTVRLVWGYRDNHVASTTLIVTNATAPVASVTRPSSFCLLIFGTAAAGASVNVETIPCGAVGIGNGSFQGAQPVAVPTNSTNEIFFSGLWQAAIANTHIIRLRSFVAEWLN